MKYTALFQVKLSHNSPSAPILHAFTFEADESRPGADKVLKTAYKAEYEKMKAQYKQYKDFKRLSICEDMSRVILVGGSTLAEILSTGETE
jgi:hypothetical protein